MISERMVWAMRDARRRLGQTKDLFITQQPEREVEHPPEPEPAFEPEFDLEHVPEPEPEPERVPQTASERGA